MFLRWFKNTVFIGLVLIFSCSRHSQSKKNKAHAISAQAETTKELVIAANRTADYLPLLENKKIGIVGNQSTVIFKEEGYTHLVDSLLSLKVNISKVFSPE